MRKHGLALTSILIALTFQGMVFVDATGLHGCPQHDELPGGSQEAPGGHQHAAHGTAVHSDGGSDHADSHEGPCTCIGNCHVGGESQAAHESARATLPSVPLAPGLEPASRTAERLPGTPSYLLPYSNAPPTPV